MLPIMPEPLEIHPRINRFAIENGELYFFNIRNLVWKPFKGSKDPRGYMRCKVLPDAINEPGRVIAHVHRLVWEVAHGPIPAGMEIDHIDRDPSNNNLSNLQCVTLKRNRALRDERIKEAGEDPQAYRRLFPVSLHEWLATAPSNLDWAGLAHGIGMHKVALLGLRCKLRKAPLAHTP